MTRDTGQVTLALLFCGLSAGLLTGCQRPEQTELTVPVTIAPGEVVKVEAPYSGIIDAVHVRKGQTVESDQPVLIEFDTAEHSLALVQAKATLSSLQTQAEILHSRGDANEAAEVDKKVAAASKRVEDVLGKIAAGAVTAGTAGRVLHVGVSQADRVARGQTLCLVAPQDQLYAMGNVSGWAEPPFEVGQFGRIVLVSDPSAAVDARVTAVRRMEFGENAWEVKLRLLSPGPFQPGMTAQARLTTSKAQPQR